MKYAIYIIQNILNDKIYVGKTGANPFSERWKQHIKESKNPKKKRIINNAIRKYGATNFVFSIIEEHETNEAASIAEIYWIDFYKSWDGAFGYNQTMGGEGVVPTQETREKMSQGVIKVRYNRGKVSASLSEKEILEIKNLLLAGELSQAAIANLYNTTPQLVGRIGKNKSFKDILKDTPVMTPENGFVPVGYKMRSGLNNSQSKFSQKEIEEIRAKYLAGTKVQDLSYEYNVSRGTISKLVHGKTYK